MTKLQAATDTVKEVAVMYLVLVLVAAGVFSIAEGASIGDSIYWAAVTATSTGYGDLSPKTWVGKIDAVLLMHGSIFFIAPMVVVRLIDKLNVDRDAFSHDEQEVMKADIAAIRAVMSPRDDGLLEAAERLEHDMRQYLFDKQPGRRIQCLDRYRKNRGLVPWADMQQWQDTH